MQKIIVVDQKKCLGCQSCRLACGLAHSDSRTLTELVYKDEPVWPRLILEQTAGGLFPLQCRQCTDAPCLAVCPTGALNRPASAASNTPATPATPDESGLQPVRYKQATCIGCRACLVICPFGLIRTAPDDRTLLKCDLCADQQAGGDKQATENFIPACVRACPTRALRYLPLKEPAQAKRMRYARSYAVAFQADFEQLLQEELMEEEE